MELGQFNSQGHGTIIEPDDEPVVEPDDETDED